MDELPDALELLQVQQARPQAAPAQAVPQGDDLPDALDLISGTTQPTRPAQPAMPPVGSRLGTFRGDRVRQAIVGQQDPRYAGIPNVASVVQQRGQSFGQIGREMGGWAVGASDADMGKAYAGMLGPDYIRTETDANGYPVVVYRDQGREAKAYVNTPGLDMQDIARGVTGALPFAKTGAVVNNLLQGSPLVGRMFGQAAGQALTSVAQDATGLATGASSPSIGDAAIKAGIAGAGGAVGEAIGAAVSPLVRRYITEPRLYNRATGELTEEGARLAREAGVDPIDLTQQVARDFARAVAQGADPEAAFRQAGSREFGIRRSAGELAGNRDQLLREQQMRGGTFGQQAREAVEAFDKAQRDDIVRATRGGGAPDQPRGFAERIAPQRSGDVTQMSQLETGRNIADNTRAAFTSAKTAEREAWHQVPRIEATDEALAMLPRVVNEALGEFDLGATTPAASKMAQQIGRFVRQEAPERVDDIIQRDPSRNVDQVRRSLLKSMMGATTGEDRAAAEAIYRSYNQWIGEAAEQMVSADPLAAAKLRTARDATRTMREIFDGQKGSQGATLLKQIMDKADSAEGIVNALFTGPTAQIKGGTMSALNNLKRAYDTYLEPAAAKAAWDDIRLAYWLKVTTDKGNDVRNPAALASSIKNMLGTQGSVARSLYTPAELASMRRLAAAMDDIKRKNPNTSWSAIGVGSLLKQGFDALLKTIGFDSVLGRTAAATFGGPAIRAYGGVQASRATGGLQGATLPNVNRLSFGGAGGAIGSQSNQ